MPPIERVLLVTERPLLIARHRQLLDHAGLELELAVIMPQVLEQNLTTAETLLVIVDTESAVPQDVLVQATLRSPHSRFVLSASQVSPDLIHKALSTGMHGVLSTMIPVDEAALALKRICRGECHYRFDESLSRTPRRMEFSERERALVSLVMKGYRNREIAITLKRSESNVKTSMNRLLRKTGARSRGELAAIGGTFQSQPVGQPVRLSKAGHDSCFDAIWMFAGRGDQS